jgi:beta-phosphoglucomutase-like phosphatase (HAD superfamily)
MWQGLSPRIPSIDFMPTVNPVLPEFPAEIDEPFIQQVGKITKPGFDVFDKHSPFVNGMEALIDFLDGLNITRANHTSSTKMSIGTGLFNLLPGVDEDVSFLFNYHPKLFQLWD